MSATTSNDVPVDIGTIIESLESAETQNQILALAGLAFAASAQQTGAISATLDSIVSAGGVPQDSLNVAATINAGSTIDANVAGNIGANVSGTVDANVSGSIGSTVTIDGLGKPATELLEGELKKAARAMFLLWAAANDRIGKFETALTCSIGKVANEISELRPLAGEIGKHVCELTVQITEMKHDLQKELKCICDHAQEIDRCIRDGEARRGVTGDRDLINVLTARLDATQVRIERIAEQATLPSEADAIKREIHDMRIAMENNAEANRVRVEHIAAQAETALEAAAGANVSESAARRAGPHPKK